MMMKSLKHYSEQSDRENLPVCKQILRNMIGISRSTFYRVQKSLNVRPSTHFISLEDAARIKAAVGGGYPEKEPPDHR